MGGNVEIELTGAGKDRKLSRLARGSSAGEDVVLDLIGYLVLLRIAERKTT